MLKLVISANTSASVMHFRSGLIKELIRQNFDIYVIAPKDDYSKKIIDLGCKYIEINVENKGVNPIQDLRLLYHFYKVYKKIRPDLIIHYTVKPNIYGTLAARLCGIKSVAVITGLGYAFINKKLVSLIVQKLYKLAFAFSNGVIFINGDDKRELLEQSIVAERVTHLIPSEGVNTDFFRPMHLPIQGDFTFLLIARVLWDKGIGEYVEAAKIITKKYNNIKFLILGEVGSDNPQAIPESKLNEWTQNNHVSYVGAVSDVRMSIAQSHCVVLPSYREGVSMSLMEAASMEKPLIATDVPGCRDVVQHEVNGFLCKVKDAQDLADGMGRMLNLSVDERVEMGVEGRKKMIKQFDEKIVVDKFLKIIRDTIGWC